MVASATAAAPPDTLPVQVSRQADVITIEGVAWSVYEGLAAARGEGRRPRLAYDNGWLEIVSPTSRHDQDAYLLGLLIEFVALELRVSVIGVRSTTYSRRDIQAGFEGDNAFYVQRAPEMREVDDVDASVHPAPDIVIEVDVSRSSKRKLALFAKYAVPEIWRVTKDRVRVYELQRGTYVERDASVALPLLTTDAIRYQLARGRTLERWEWADEIRAWLRDQTRIDAH